MSFLPSGQIFRELQVVHDTGYFSAMASLEDRWHEVCKLFITITETMRAHYCWLLCVGACI